MSIMDALLATMCSDKEGVKGRTLLQKKMYFLALLVGENYRFSPYYYGPYSSIVADRLGALCEAALISEEAENYPDHFNSVGELRRFDYRLTKAGEEVADRRSKSLETYKKQLSRINAHPVAHEAKLLSTAAKVHFIVSEHRRLTVGEIRTKANVLGWNLQPEQIDKVVDFLEHLGLAKER